MNLEEFFKSDCKGEIKVTSEGENKHTLSYFRPRIEHVLNNRIIEPDLRRLCENGIELSVTFIPCLQISCTPAHLTNLVASELEKYYKRYKIEVMLIGEYSIVGKYHMHGAIIADPRVINILQRKFAKMFGRCEWKAIKYVESWVKYCLKDEKTNKEKEIRETEFISYISP